MGLAEPLQPLPHFFKIPEVWQGPGSGFAAEDLSERLFGQSEGAWATGEI